MKNKLTFWIITSVFSIIVIYALVSTVIMPAFTKNPLPKASSVRVSEEKAKTEKSEGKKKPVKVENNKSDDDTISDLSVSNGSKDEKMKLFELRKREILLRSRLNLANEDSTYLVIDLINNFAILELKGILLHEAPIISYKISNSIKTNHTEALLNWMAQPFTVRRIDATIPKIEFVEKLAPKDSIEANKASAEPVARKLGDVYIVMDFDRNLRVVVSQNEQLDEDGQKIISALRWKYHQNEIRKSLQSLIKFNREPVMPQIDIVLSKSDATILYKALPVRPRMILRM
jgi:hypothetical protein